MKEDLTAFKQLIKRHCGLQLEGIAEDRLRKALKAAAITAGVQHLQDFLPLLVRDTELTSDLVSQLTVNETYFFRESSQIELLTQQLLPRLLNHKKKPIKILSAGCSSGEEPYSLVIALEETWGQAAQEFFQVEAGDLDRQILQKARLGQYSPFSFRGVSQAVRKRYFQPLGTYFQLKPEICDQVTFHDLNLLAPKLPEQLTGFDVIFFRNVSIYFDLETRQTIQEKLFQMMSDQGVLVMGSSETLANNLGVFQLVEEQGIYYFVKGQQLLPPQILQEPPTKSPSKPLPLPKARSRPVDAPKPKRAAITSMSSTSGLLPVKSILQLIEDQDFSLALHQLDRLLAAGQNTQDARLLKAWLLGNRKEFQLAEDLLSEVLNLDPWFFDALFLQALLDRWQSKTPEALKGFKKAAFIQTDSWPAHYYLAESYRLSGQREQALQAYQTARRLLMTGSHPNSGLQLLPLALAPGDLRFLIDHQIERLNQRLAAHGSERS